jgi:hypothetical protein
MGKENDILKKAQTVEKEMAGLRQEKIDLLCSVFKEQLIADMDKDLNSYDAKLN